MDVFTKAYICICEIRSLCASQAITKEQLMRSWVEDEEYFKGNFKGAVSIDCEGC